MTGATEATLAELLRVAQNTNASIITLNRLIAKNAGVGGSSDSSSGGGSSGIMSTLMAPVSMAASLLGSVIKTAVGLFGDLVTGVMNTGANLVEFAKKAAMGTARLSDFYDAFRDLPFGLGMLASAIAGLVKFAEEQLDTYRAISKSGAQFAGELFTIRANAGAVGMSLKDFQETLLKNSEVFAQAGGGVQRGVNVFVGGMAALWQGRLRPVLLGLGVSASEAGEYMATFMKATRYSANSQGENSQTLAKKTYDYILSLDQMTKLTGVHRDQLNEMVKKQADDQVWQAFLAGLDPKVAASKAQALLQASGLYGAKYAEQVIRDQLMGIETPLTDAAVQAAVVTNGMSVDIARRMNQITENMTLSQEQRDKLLQELFLQPALASKKFTDGLGKGGEAVHRSLFDQVTGLLKLQNQITAAGGTVDGFKEAIVKTAEQAAQAGSAAAAMGEMEEKIKSFGNMIASIMNQLLILMLPKLMEWANRFLQWASTMIQDKFPAVAEGVDRVIIIFEKYILPRIMDVFGWFGDTFKLLTETPTDKFWPTLVKRVGDGLIALWNWLKPVWVNDIKPVLISIFESLGDYLKPILERLWARIGGYIKDAINEWRNDVSFGLLGEDPKKRKLARDVEESQWAVRDAQSDYRAALADPKSYSKERTAELWKVVDAAQKLNARLTREYTDAGGTFASPNPKVRGGSINPGSYLVGENGPEVMNVGASGDIISNDNLRAALARMVSEKPTSTALEELNNTMKQLLRYAASTSDNTGRTVGAVAQMSGNIMPTI